MTLPLRKKPEPDSQPVPRWQYEAFRRWYVGDPKAAPDPIVGRAIRPPGG